MDDLSTFKPVDALLGGALVGTGTGMAMLLSKRVAGNSGVLKSLVVGPRDAKVAYVAGLVVAGVLLNLAAPVNFETPREPTSTTALWGIIIGLGTTLANGCTSGHGLCGLSRFSRRSFAAVPIFMMAAVVTSTITTSLRTESQLGPPAPAVMITSHALHVALTTVGALVLALVPTLWHWSVAREAGKESPLVTAWSGLCAGAGLAIGGMVRPSVIQQALSPYRVDFTLWVLFTAALVTTFVFYRVAYRVFGVAEACAVATSKHASPIDARLIIGAALFGIGWGATGLCPGPLIVLVAAQPTNVNSILCLLGVVVGMLIAESVEMRRLFDIVAACCSSTRACPTSPTSTSDHQATPAPTRQSAAPAPALATRDDLEAALGAGAWIVEVRPAVSSEATGCGAFCTLEGAVSVLWDDSKGMMAIEALPAVKSTPLILICRTGRRAGKAATFLATCGYTRVLNGGGPLGHAEQWSALVSHCRELTSYSSRGEVRQLLDPGSSTYTYILTDSTAKEAIIIDPVLEQVARDLEAVREMGCKLVFAFNTHCHADHITGTGQLKELVPDVRSCIARAAGAKADVLLEDGQTVRWADGTRSLTVLATPGHTNGCVSYHDADMNLVCTGDALLIDGCGRTDFQEGDAATLYESVHDRLFALPTKTLVLPAHDYKGRSFSTIGAQRASNARLTKTKDEFVKLMSGLELPYPKKLDSAVPANLQCGVFGT